MRGEWVQFTWAGDFVFQLFNVLCFSALTFVFKQFVIELKLSPILKVLA